ncbi:hypothetical protein D3C78_763440 [compost metagenome]
MHQLEHLGYRNRKLVSSIAENFKNPALALELACHQIQLPHSVIRNIRNDLKLLRIGLQLGAYGLPLES